MADHDDELDSMLSARFSSEHRHVPAEPFTAATLRGIRLLQQRQERRRMGLRVAVVALLVVASPWLVAVVERFHVAWESAPALSGPAVWILAALAVAGALGLQKLRGR